MSTPLGGALAALLLFAATAASAQPIQRDRILKDPKVFALFVTLKVRPEFAALPAGERRTDALGQLQSLVANNRENVLADFYLTRGLDAASDILVRVHAYDLAKAQNFVIDLRNTILGRHCDVTQTFVGMTSPLIYADKNPALMDSLKATTYSDAPPRFVVMIPVKKNAEWWGLPQEERQKLIEEHSVRTLGFLSSIRRKLYHATGLDDVDFVTFFEFADLSAFHDMAKVLMSVKESRYHVEWGSPTVLGRIETLENIVNAVAGD